MPPTWLSSGPPCCRPQAPLPIPAPSHTGSAAAAAAAASAAATTSGPAAAIPAPVPSRSAPPAAPTNVPPLNNSNFNYTQHMPPQISTMTAHQTPDADQQGYIRIAGGRSTIHWNNYDAYVPTQQFLSAGTTPEGLAGILDGMSLAISGSHDGHRQVHVHRNRHRHSHSHGHGHSHGRHVIKNNDTAGDHGNENGSSTSRPRTRISSSTHHHHDNDSVHSGVSSPPPSSAHALRLPLPAAPSTDRVKFLLPPPPPPPPPPPSTAAADEEEAQALAPPASVIGSTRTHAPTIPTPAANSTTTRGPHLNCAVCHTPNQRDHGNVKVFEDVPLCYRCACERFWGGGFGRR